MSSIPPPSFAIDRGRPIRSIESRRRSRARVLDLDRLEGRWGASTWAGVVDGLWSNNANWDEPPTSGSSLTFPSGASNLVNTNDLAAETEFSAILVTDVGYAIGGNAIVLTGPITAVQLGGPSQIALPIQINGNSTVDVSFSATLDLAGVLSGTGGIVKVGDGTLRLTADNTYQGQTVASGGILLVNGAQAGNAVVITTGGVAGGIGAVASVTSTGGTVRPGNASPVNGDFSPGRLNVADALNLDASSTFAIALNGLIAGDEYSQVQVAGPVNLGGASLLVSVGFAPTGKPSFTVIDNTGTNPVSNTFAGLPEGGTFSASGQTFQVSYVGGDGNDVVLTRLIGTTTSLIASPENSVFGQSVSLSATVIPDEVFGEDPTGSVTFFAGTTSLGTAPLSSGVATLDTSSIPVGSNAVTAQYLGDSNHASSTSDASTVTVAKAMTTTSLLVEPDFSVFGQNVILTATLAVQSPGAGVPTGEVEFFNGADSIGLAAIVGDVASFSTTNLAVGTNTITAHYLGDDNFTESTSAEAIASVSQADTTTVVTATPNPSGEGELVTLSASVTVVAPGSGGPSGSVEFFNGVDSLGTVEVIGGVATFQTSSLPRANNPITAQYQGDLNFLGSVSEVVNVNVLLVTTTSLSVAPTSSVFGQSVTFTATVTGNGDPTGQVEFFAGATSLGTSDLTAGVATLTTSSLPTGNSQVTARYLGDPDFAPSVSTAVDVVVAMAETTTTLTAVPDASVHGQSVTFTATVAASAPGAGTPTGTITFFLGLNPLGNATLVGGVATLDTTSLPVGSNAVTASYEGDGNFGGSTSSAATVTVSSASTTTTLTAAPSSAVFGQAVVLTATLAVVSPGSGVPTGTVEFLNGTTSIGSATLNAGVATLTTSSLPVGSNAITARYQGDPNFLASTSATLSQQVNAVSTVTTLSASDLNPRPFSTVTFTATVAARTGNVSPTGLVEFFSGGVSLGTATLETGQATLTIDSVPVGVFSVTAQYQGDANASPSVSDPLTLTVGTANEQYVNALYLGLMGRDADAVGLSFWSGLLDRGRSRVAVVTLLYNSRESRTFQVQQVYQTFLGREATPGEVRRTIQAAFDQGTNYEGVVLGTREYYRNVGGGTISGYLDALAQDVLGTSSFNPAVKQSLAAQLQQGVAPVEVATEVLTSYPGKSSLVQSSVESILGRQATVSEVDGLLSLNGGQIYLRQIQILLYASAEFYELATGEPPATVRALRAR